MISGKTFHVTGSTGQLGCLTVLRLEELGARVIPIVLEGYSMRPKREPWPARTAPVRVKVPGDLSELPFPEYVINFHWRLDSSATHTEQILYQIDYNIHRPSFYWDWLAEREPRMFTNISTIKVFSEMNENPIDDRTEPRPATPYGIAKLTAEKFFDARFSRSVCGVSHLRLCSVASASEHPSKMISRLCESAFEARRIRVNAGHATMLFFIDDMVDMIINASLIGEGKRYNITSDPIPITDIVAQFERISGKRINAEYIDLDPNSRDPLFISDARHFQGGWTKATSLETALRKVIKQRYPDASFP